MGIPKMKTPPRAIIAEDHQIGANGWTKGWKALRGMPQGLFTAACQRTCFSFNNNLIAEILSGEEGGKFTESLRIGIFLVLN